MSHEILINHTFTETTPESAENGDYFDSGFIAQLEPVTFRELVELMKEHPHASQWTNHGPVFSPNTWFSSDIFTTSYTKNTERETAIHYSKQNPERNIKYWNWAAKIAYKG